MSEASTRLSAALAARYRIERELGQGGMATVYLAEDLKHKRRVALKVLKPELAAVLGAERFVQEITTTASLQHPHILPLFDSGTADGFLYYVMPFIDGETLRARLDRETQLGVDDAVRITTDVASALQYAHEHGVIHRDIKPENILLHDGRPVVADFGIALAVSAAAGGRMTETGLSLGTPHYMSPEQATAEKEITARSDVYSLASVLYEMLAGQPPHLGGSAQQVIMKIIAEPVPAVTQFRKTVPPNVAAAVARALEKLPADRFTSAKAFAEALANPAFTVAAAGVDRLTGPTGRYRRAAMALGVIAILTTALALWGWLSRGSSTVAARSSWRTTLQLTDTTATVERETFLSMSRDGSLLVFSGGWGPTRGLYLRRAGDERATLIRGTEGAFVGAIAPNGKHVAVKGPLGVTVVPVEGGTPRRVTMAELVTPFDWIDDEHLVIDQGDGLHRVTVAGGEMVRLTTVDTAAGEGYHIAPAVLPDGGVVFTVIMASSLDAAEMHIATVGPAGGVHVPLGQGVKAVFAAPGYLLIRTGTGSLDALPFNPARRQATGPRQTILSGLTSGLFNNSGEFAVAVDGHLVYMADPFEGDREVVTVSRNGAARSLASAWIGNFESVSLSPDGQRIAAGMYSAANEEVQVRHLASGATTRISIAGAQLRDPAWAPSGDAIYFSALGTGHMGLYRVGLGAGAVAARVVTQRDRVLDQPAPSVDGRLVYYTARGVNDIAFREVAGADSAGSVLEQTPEAEVAPVPSPDGRWLAFWSLETGLMIRSADPARAERIVVYRGSYNLASPRWSRDGTELFFPTADSLMAVAVATGNDFTMGTPRALFALGRLRPNFDVKANGEFIMLRHLASRPNPPSLVLLADWKSLLRP